MRELTIPEVVELLGSEAAKLAIANGGKIPDGMAVVTVGWNGRFQSLLKTQAEARQMLDLVMESAGKTSRLLQRCYEVLDRAEGSDVPCILIENWKVEGGYEVTPNAIRLGQRH